MERLYPIGIQSFEEIRKGGFLYVDKTERVYRMVKSGKYYFLSRPRRFGKSLLISTLEAYFRGRRELFAGLAMERLEREWTTYPVFHLDLNARKYNDVPSLVAILNQHLEIWEGIYGDEKKDRAPEERFAYLIENACRMTGRNVVILVDEYDKPMLQAIGDEALRTEYQNILKAFYGVLKSSDRYIRFALLTGVTKFSKVSVFSDLNNLEDISMARDYESVCGITEEELRSDLRPDIHLLAEAMGIDDAEAFGRLKAWYDGYHFAAGGADVYNPFSLLSTLKRKEFGSYWFETGTPTFLVELLRRSRYDLSRLADERTTSDVLGSVDSMADDPIPVLYQSGYLTIKGYDARFGLYRLGFPNEEVTKGFMSFLLPYYAPIQKSESVFQISRFVEEVEAGDLDSFMLRLRSFFADTPYELARDRELHYQNVLFLVFKLMGFYMRVEYHTSRGRVDLVLMTDRYIYVMEFKLDGTAEEALRQIEEKGYAEPFARDGRKLLKVGVNFSSASRNIERWLVKMG